ncbi:MAG: Mur ligase family protein [Candidatus Eisenbacteria bacterium]
MNLSPDHLDRHESFAAYRAAKLRMFQNQTAEDVAVLGDGPDMDELARVGSAGPMPPCPDEGSWRRRLRSA